LGPPLLTQAWVGPRFAVLGLRQVDGALADEGKKSGVRALGPSGREFACVPIRGDRIELLRLGLRLRGRVFYADALQVLVKMG
jgi:hypothetical protein